MTSPLTATGTDGWQAVTVSAQTFPSALSTLTVLYLPNAACLTDIALPALQSGRSSRSRGGLTGIFSKAPTSLSKSCNVLPTPALRTVYPLSLYSGSIPRLLRISAS